MGIGNQGLNLTLSLWLDGHFKDFKSVIELGSQDIHAKAAEVDLVLAQLTRKTGITTRDPNSRSDQYVPKAMYEALGFSDYQCIDMDGRNGALVYDLNEDLKAKGLSKQFDLVTNHGTTEHCFNQQAAFRNIHNLCRSGGVMYHALPFQGYLNHGFYNYQPSFFRNLAAANQYAIIGLYVNLDDECADLSTYSDHLMKYISVPASTNMALHVALQKTSDAEFRTPFDGSYLAGSKLKDAYSFQKSPKLLLPLGVDELGETLPARKLAELVATKISRKIRSYF